MILLMFQIGIIVAIALALIGLGLFTHVAETVDEWLRGRDER